MIEAKDGGITLVALVVTVIGLLILAGITISTLSNTGIFDKAKKATQSYSEAQNYEKKELETMESYLYAGKVLRVENKIQYVSDGKGNIIPVPEGFTYLEGNKDEGFVIKNSNDGNEFVWIPVENKYERIVWEKDGWKYSQKASGIDIDTNSIKITRADMNYNDKYYFVEKLDENELNSVTKYRGFYIGRYETGIKGYKTLNLDDLNVTTAPNKNWTGYEDGTISIQKNLQVWNYVTFKKAEDLSKSLYTKEKNKGFTKLCSSYAMDMALKFIDRNNINWSINGIGNSLPQSTSYLEKTGYISVNNIYDLQGNARELNSEKAVWKDENHITIRGSSYSEGFPVAIRTHYYENFASVATGFRICMYL